ncbi:MAG: hypothetical protein P8N09_08630 [Planctomycetota bacterium]|nr:hypothetical protein [Planctomycetota bacterium]
MSTKLQSNVSLISPRPFLCAVRALIGALSLFLAGGMSASDLNAQFEYCEEDGLLVLEIEDQAPAGGWVEETQFSGFSGYGGPSYFRWAGGNQFNSPGHGVLTYTLNIATAGDYQMRIYNHHNDPDSTQENDCWTRMDGGTWVKTYSSQNNWNWVSRFEYSNGTKETAHFNLSEGLHTFEISGRSQNFRIDRAHFFLSGNPTNTSFPPSPTGPCDGPPPHPEENPHSITAVFSDGTLGPLEVKLGNPVTLPNPVLSGRHLALTENSRLVLPDVTYTDQEILLKVRKGMPVASWVGAIVRASDEGIDFATAGGDQSMVFMQRQANEGRVRVSVHDGSSTVFSGAYFPLAEINVDADDVEMHISISGDTVQCTLNGLDALSGGYTGISDPALGGYTSIRGQFSPANPGTIGIDYGLMREAGDIPDLHFDADGKLWMSALEENLLVPPTWAPASFGFHHDAFLLGLPSFVSIVFPYFDYVQSSDDHFVLGVVESGLALPEGSSNVFDYKGQSEGEYQP